MEAVGYPGLAGASGSEKMVLGFENGLWRNQADRHRASQARVERKLQAWPKNGVREVRGIKGAQWHHDWHKDEGRKPSPR